MATWITSLPRGTDPGGDPTSTLGLPKELCILGNGLKREEEKLSGLDREAEVITAHVAAAVAVHFQTAIKNHYSGIRPQSLSVVVARIFFCRPIYV